MSVSLAGYTTTKLVRTSARGAVYEAERQRDGKRVLAKVFDLHRPGDEARVEHELRLLQELDLEGVVRPIGLQRAGHQVVLLLDYVDGQNLSQWVANAPMSVATFLPRALEIAAVLGQIHARRIVHRDIKPSNVMIEAGTDKVVFADFGISVLLEDERRRPHAPEILEGTLPYISPEQTGRTKGEIDFRSDLYSLGVTFYELLTGRRPFEAQAPLELIHAHLAQRPRPPAELVETIPATLSAIVMKLLEKAPERRYQSAEGLCADLERLADALAAGELDPRFELGTRDHSTRLQLPHQLYGRERERELLDAQLLEIIDDHSRRLVLLSGAAGSGKSALIRDYEALLSAEGGMLGVGKFERPGEEGRSEQPYRGFAGALSEIVRQLLTSTDAELAVWRVRLREALGPIAAVVGALVPELALVIGEMTPVPSVELGDARNRLHLALARFVSALAEDGPLVVVLDDLQWADAGSVELLEVLLDESGSPVLFVGCFREDELEPDHPVRALQARLDARSKADGAVTFGLELAPLSDPALEQMLADALGRERGDEALESLAELIGRRTGNNPMFVRQYLVHLEDLGLLHAGPSGWTWDLDEVSAAVIPDDLLGVMQAKLGRLPDASRELLEVAACIGVHFELELLDAGDVGDVGDAGIVGMLWELEVHGLVTSVADGYRFAHDRIQEVARAGIGPKRRHALHRAIGLALLEAARAEAGTAALGERLFPIVDQLDQGFASVDELDTEAREQVAQLNLEAGRQALDSAAWRSALGYFEVAVAASGDRRDDDAFEAHFGRAQGLALADDKAAAEAAFTALTRWQLSDAQFGRVAARRVRILQMRDHVTEALDYGRVALERLGLTLPAKPSMPKMLLAVFSAWGRVKKADLEHFATMPACTDERQNARMHVLAAVMPPAFTVEPQLFVYLAAVHTRLVMTHGFHPSAPETIAQLAFTMSGLGQTGAALELCDTLIELCERRETTAISPSTVRNIKLMFGPAGQPFADTAVPIEDAVMVSLEIGDRLGAGYLAAIGPFIHMEAGTHLAEVGTLDARMREALPDYGSREMSVLADTGRRFRETIAAEREADAPGFAKPDDYTEWKLSAVTHYAIAFAEVWGRLLLEEHAPARAVLKPLRGDYEQVMFGMWVVPRVALCDAILSGEEAQTASGSTRRRALRRLRKSLAVLRKWAQKCPENYAPMFEIAAGELAWSRGRHREAGDHFERGRAGAVESGRVYLEAFANLRQAALADALGWGPAAEGARRAAHAALSRWGAWAAVRRLEREHPSLAFADNSRDRRRTHESSFHPAGFESSVQLETFDTLIGDGSSNSSVSSLDLQSVLGTMQAIAEDLELEEVIGRVLDSAIENAGADRGALLLERAGVVEVVAESDTDSTSVVLDHAASLREARDRIPTSLVNLVLRTGEAFVVDDARLDPRFSSDPYIETSGVRSLLCMPIVKQSQRIGALVVENRLNAGSFTEDRLETLRILLNQGASALDNARLYAKLQRSEDRWRSLVNGVPDIISLLDAEGRVEFINHLGVPGARIDHVGMRGDAYMDTSSAERWREALSEVVATGEPRELEVSVTPPNASRRFFALRIMPSEVGGDAARYLSIATDITDAKGLEAQLRQQQRLESLGTLASGVAHEINNPIQGVLSYAEMLAEQPDDPETVREFTSEITQAADRVIGIVRNLLAFSRQELGPDFEPCEISRLIDTTLSLIRAVLRKDMIKLEVDIAPYLPEVRCRMQQIQQIIMNLVTNARDALNERYPKHHETKRIAIRARAIEREGRQWVQISVEDQAGGIPEHLRTQIFDPFFTTKGRDHGTGLGLAVSHGIATEHGGELVVETEVGVGSTFHLCLPADG